MVPTSLFFLITQLGNKNAFYLPCLENSVAQPLRVDNSEVACCSSCLRFSSFSQVVAIRRACLYHFDVGRFCGFSKNLVIYFSYVVCEGLLVFTEARRQYPSSWSWNHKGGWEFSRIWVLGTPSRSGKHS